jgi:hypothetical protein
MQLKGIGIVAAVGAAAAAIGTGVAAAQPDDGEGTPITGDALTTADGSQVDVQLDQNCIVVGLTCTARRTYPRWFSRRYASKRST